MGWSNPLLTAPIGVGDLSSALNVASLDVGTIISTSSTLCEMAKFKAVRSSNPGILTESERAATRFGFGSIPTVSPSSFQSSPARWTYQRPRGLATYNEWYRMLDFDGYHTGCCAPFLLVVEDQYTAGSPIRIQIETNHRIDDYPGYSWEGIYNLTFEELLQGDRNSNYFVHLFIKKTSGTGSGTLNIVVLKNDSEGNTMPLTVLAPNNLRNGIEAVFQLYPNGDGGFHCPAIPVLQNAVSGDTFAIYAAFGTIPGSVDSNYYQVYTSVPSMTWYSLNMDGNNNNGQFAMTQLVNNVSGSVSYVHLRATSDYFTDIYDNQYRKFIIEGIQLSVTTGSLNVGTGVNMTFRLNLDGSAGTMTGFVGVIENGEIVEVDSSHNNYCVFANTFTLYSNQSYTYYMKNGSSSDFTDRYFWAMWDGDPDDTYILAVDCSVERQSYPAVTLTGGTSNTVHYND